LRRVAKYASEEGREDALVRAARPARRRWVTSIFVRRIGLEFENECVGCESS
jgi:hypothetical protein